MSPGFLSARQRAREIVPPSLPASHREGEQRSVTLKDFFGETHLRDIKPMMIETFKRERLATPTKHDKEDRPRPRTPASVNSDLACLSKILSMAFDNELIDSNPMRRVRMLKESLSRERFITAEQQEEIVCVGGMLAKKRVS